MSLNNDLQTNHKVVRFLEEAKAQSEIVLDGLPGIFAVIDAHGNIFRGNCQLAEILGVEFENIAGNNLSKIFPKSKWDDFKNHILESIVSPELITTFEMDLIGKNKLILNHILNIRTMQNADYKSTELNLFVLIGNDITSVKQVTQKMSRMEDELKTAKAVQDTLFPDPSEFANAAFSLAGSYQPASECGGDWWFYNTIGQQVFFWIGDVTGHGVSAALITSAARAAVSGIETHTVMTPSLALSILNKAVYDASKGKKYMSFCVVALDLATGKCTYATAGHELPYIIRHQPGRSIAPSDISFLPGGETTFLLGQQENSSFEDAEIKLNPGDRIFLFTDGVNELVNEFEEQWGNRRVKQALNKCANDCQTSPAFISEFNKYILEYKKETELLDDVTFFIFQFLNFHGEVPDLKFHHSE